MNIPMFDVQGNIILQVVQVLLTCLICSEQLSLERIILTASAKNKRAKTIDHKDIVIINEIQDKDCKEKKDVTTDDGCFKRQKSDFRVGNGDNSRCKWIRFNLMICLFDFEQNKDFDFSITMTIWVS